MAALKRAALAAAYETFKASPPDSREVANRNLRVAAISSGMSINNTNPEAWAYGKLARSGGRAQ